MLPGIPLESAADYLYALECALKIDLGKDSTLSNSMRNTLNEIYGQFKAMHADILAELPGFDRNIRGAKAFANCTRLPETVFGMEKIARHAVPDCEESKEYFSRMQME